MYLVCYLYTKLYPLKTLKQKISTKQQATHKGGVKALLH